ncbi:hypothetical protein NM04_14995 [Massilia aurea]|uniref:Uncharacterized protein n=1 Tax=Massilia aurea TaxID=373040 RepID=A0A422QJ76_9BURK|nr:hypothetical protein [Massilia aurea]RNF30039.1 hypothetical protein NM04_14995 [Massilia aurea]
MSIKMLKLRARGVEVPKRSLHDRFNIARAGSLEVLDTTSQGLHRMAKVAKFTYRDFNRAVDELYDPHLLWWNGGRFVLSGFERIKNESLEVVDFAQSWLCFHDVEPPTAPEGR